MKNLKKINFNLRVLGYREGNEFVLHCLEMDLKGYGKTIRQSFNHLIRLVLMQLTFAIQKKEYNLMWFPADDKYIRLYEELLA